METLLSVFDQDNRTEDHHILNVNEDDFPEEYRPLIRRLKEASSDPEVKNQMRVEDEYLRYIQDVEREADYKVRKEMGKVVEKKDKVIKEKDKEIKEKDKKLKDKDKKLEEKDKKLEEKDKTIEENYKTIEEKNKENEALKQQIERLQKKNKK
jgi:peptidoglycan hydrolase CwlO-like protein